MRERADRCRRADENVGIVEEGTEFCIEFCLRLMRPGNVRQGIAQSPLRIVDDIRSELVATVFQLLLVRGDELNRPQDFKRLVHVRKIRIAMLHVGEYGTEARDLCLEHFPNVIVDRRTTEVCRNGNLERPEVGSCQRIRNSQQIITREGIILVQIKLGQQQQVSILHAARHWTQNRHGQKRHGPCRARHKPWRRAEADDAAEGCGRTQAAAVIGPCRKRHHARRDRHARPTGRSATCLVGVKWIARRAKHTVGGIGTCTKLRRIGLAKDDAALCPDIGDDRIIVIRHMVLVEQRAVCRAQAFCRL